MTTFLKDYCRNGGSVESFLDEDDNWVFEFSSPTPTTDALKEKVCQEMKDYFYEVTPPVTSSPDAYIIYNCRKCHCCDDVVMSKTEIHSI